MDAAIYVFPYRTAIQLGLKLLVYGEMLIMNMADNKKKTYTLRDNVKTM